MQIIRLFRGVVFTLLLLPNLAPTTAPAQEDGAPADKASGRPVLRGRLTDDRGQPVEGVRVITYGGMATRFKGQETTSDKDGQFRFDPLSTGNPIASDDYEDVRLVTGVVFEHESLVPADATSWRDISIPRDEGELVLDLTMTPGGTVEGEFKDARSGEPLADATMIISNTFFNRDKVPGFWRYLSTDDKGRFNSGPLFPGRYVIEYGRRKIGDVTIRANQTTTVKLTTEEMLTLQDPFKITGTAMGDDGQSMVYGGVGVRVVGEEQKLRSPGGGIDGRNVFHLSFGPIERSAPTASKPYGIGTHDVELFGYNDRLGYELAKRTPSEPLRITDDPNQPELEDGIRYIRPNQPLTLELIFTKRAGGEAPQAEKKAPATK